MTHFDQKKSIRVLLARIVDYAGLFPPAQLSMAEAVSNYAAYRKSDYEWLLGRFIFPVARLEEFVESAKSFFANDDKVWKLSILASDDIYETVRRVEEFNHEYAGKAVCDALEVKATTAYQIKEIADAVTPNLKTYFEIPIDNNLVDLVSTLAITGQRAKIRTGGTTPEAFPPVEQIVRFMRVCLAANVPFKATAGLHHPLRCIKPLTYERDAPEGTMNGFLNVFLAAAFLREGFQTTVVSDLLKDQRADNFQFTDDGVLWRQEHFLNNIHIENLRTRNAISFGSCSFVEPIEDLQEIGLL